MRIVGRIVEVWVHTLPGVRVPPCSLNTPGETTTAPSDGADVPDISKKLYRVQEKDGVKGLLAPIGGGT